MFFKNLFRNVAKVGERSQHAARVGSNDLALAKRAISNPIHTLRNPVKSGKALGKAALDTVDAVVDVGTAAANVAGGVVKDIKADPVGRRVMTYTPLGKQAASVVGGTAEQVNQIGGDIKLGTKAARGFF